MGRVQLALNVSDIEEAVDFYSRLFGVAPSKRRPGYANFIVADPPLKLVLTEAGEPGTLNHLGVEVETPREVGRHVYRLQEAGLATTVEEKVDCCYALQDKVWVSDPDGANWEWYTVLDESEVAVTENCGCDCC